jgi:hypothetical protein
VKTIERWAARPSAGEYLRPLVLATCTSPTPAQCPLQGTCELHSAESPEWAIRSLARGIGAEKLPQTTHVKRFRFVGPVAEVDDREAERRLVAKSMVSALWPELRELAEQRNMGVIELRQMGRLLVPPHALAQSFGTLEWLDGDEWTLSTELALAEVAGAQGDIHREDW